MTTWRLSYERNVVSMFEVLQRAALVALLLVCDSRAAELVIGSKAFTESVILGEIAARAATAAGHDVTHRRELGGTRILWSALTRGDIDVYPEYTGTLATEILGLDQPATLDQLRGLLADRRLRISAPLGFNNTYVLGMRRDRANALGIDRLSQLQRHPTLSFGFTNEFMQRADGWPGLRAQYRLSPANVNGMVHELAYRGLASGSLDVIDLYSTDAEIRQYDIFSLQDDLNFFPRYDAVLVYRSDAADAIASMLTQMEGRIDEASMTAMNARVKIDRVPEVQVAAEFLNVSHEGGRASRASRIWRRTLEHLSMVGASLAAALALALPLGVLAYKKPRLGHALLGTASVLQTLPALALLVVLIPWLGVGYAPAVFALFVYSLLPILRNTQAGLAGIDRTLIESATAMGLSERARLRYIELPLALPVIVAGIKTAAVINVGTATLGALVGAGGYGQPILTGVRLDDTALILEGALPAAALALLVQGAFGAIERTVRRRTH